jgi:hypothetical protein
MLLSTIFQRTFYIILTCIFSFITLFGQSPNYVDGDDIKNIISIIASDTYMGRETGTEGCRMTEEFFAQEYKKLKLEPAGENGSYFFTYTIPFFRVDGNLDLIVDARKFYYGRSEDYRVANYSSGGNAEGEVVFAGYGINSQDLKRNDFENIDIHGKIVLLRRGCPRNEWTKWKEVAIDSIKAAYCKKAGAVGMLLFEPAQTQQFQAPSPRPDREVSNELSQIHQLENFPIFIVDERVVRYILRDADPSYNTLLRKMDTASVSTITQKTVKMSAQVTYDRERKTRDVLAMIKGTDSKLKKEAVMIGGHMDHVGIDIDGKVYNGADDNASGSSVVLGVARAMIKHNFKPKRTVIFAVWSGEEKGLLGSEAWCKNPTWKLEDMVVYFNLDMVGLGEPKLNLPGSYYASEVWDEIVKNTDSTVLKNVTTSRGGPGGSDHTPFLQKGVPAMFGMSSGSHPNYHQPGDDPELIQADILRFIGDFMYHSIDVIANSSRKFITENRNAEGKFKLATIFNLAPVRYDSYKDKLTSKETDISLIDFSESYDHDDIDRNFLNILRLADEALKTNPTSKDFSFIQNPNEMGGLSYSNKIGLIGTINLSAIGYNSLYAKILAKTGVKLGILDRGASIARQSTDDQKILKTITDAGMAIFLNDLPTNELMNILAQTEKPVAIVSSDFQTYPTDGNISTKSGNHIFVYRIHDEVALKQILDNISFLKQKWGDDNFALTLGDYNESSPSKIQQLYLAIENKFNDNEFTNKIFSGNIRKFLQSAMQETQQTVTRGRPF